MIVFIILNCPYKGGFTSLGGETHMYNKLGPLVIPHLETMVLTCFDTEHH